MKKNNLIITVVALLVVISTIGVGFALNYTAIATTNNSGNNSIAYEGHVVDIMDGQQSLGSAIPINNPTYSQDGNTITVTASSTSFSYNLKVQTVQNGTLKVRAWIELNDVRTWVIIDSITLTVDGNNVPFALSNGISSVPSGVMNLSNGNHPFTVTITFRAMDIELDSGVNTTDNTDFLNLTGSRIVFLAGDTDPLTSS